MGNTLFLDTTSAEHWRAFFVHLGLTDGIAWGLNCTFSGDRVTISPGAVFFQGAMHAQHESTTMDYNGGIVFMRCDNTTGSFALEILPALPNEAGCFRLCGVARVQSHLLGDSPDLSGAGGVALGGTGAQTTAGTASALGAAFDTHGHSAANFTTGTLPLARGGMGSASGNGIVALRDGAQFVELPNGAALNQSFQPISTQGLFNEQQAALHAFAGWRVLINADNLNNLRTQGITWWLVDATSQPTNRPTAQTLMFVKVESAGNVCIQTALCGNRTSNPPVIQSAFVRVFNGSTWAAWTMIPTTPVAGHS